jgi:hypothetical protein
LRAKALQAQRICSAARPHQLPAMKEQLASKVRAQLLALVEKVPVPVAVLAQVPVRVPKGKVEPPLPPNG